MRYHKHIHIFKQKALQWAASFEVCCCLNSNHYTDPYTQYDCLIAAGTVQLLSASAGNAFDQLRLFYDEHQDWMFGLLSYELKNEIEDLATHQKDELNFPDLYFFVPQYLIALEGDTVKIIRGDLEIIKLINKINLTRSSSKAKLTIEKRFDKETYVATVESLQSHIKRGDIYEINFCQEFFAAHAHIDPLAIYKELNAISPTPFSVFLS